MPAFLPIKSEVCYLAVLAGEVRAAAAPPLAVLAGGGGVPCCGSPPGSG